jgi:hypothetical protein
MSSLTSETFVSNITKLMLVGKTHLKEIQKKLEAFESLNRRIVSTVENSVELSEPCDTSTFYQELYTISSKEEFQALAATISNIQSVIEAYKQEIVIDLSRNIEKNLRVLDEMNRDKKMSLYPSEIVSSHIRFESPPPRKSPMPETPPPLLRKNAKDFTSREFAPIPHWVSRDDFPEGWGYIGFDFMPRGEFGQDEHMQIPYSTRFELSEFAIGSGLRHQSVSCSRRSSSASSSFTRDYHPVTLSARQRRE